jgi:hypothetical protein
VKSARQQILADDAAHAACSVAGADEHHGSRGQQPIEIADGHGRTLAASRICDMMRVNDLDAMTIPAWTKPAA